MHIPAFVYLFFFVLDREPFVSAEHITGFENDFRDSLRRNHRFPSLLFFGGLGVLLCDSADFFGRLSGNGGHSNAGTCSAAAAEYSGLREAWRSVRFDCVQFGIE